MTIKFDLDYDEARALLARLNANPLDRVTLSAREDLIDALENALQNEDERCYEAHQESLMESGGVDDSRYRQDLLDSGRGHLLR